MPKAIEVQDALSGSEKMKLKNCNFCGACAIQYTHPDVNYKGESGYKSTVNCSKCIKHIERWAKIKEAAEQMAANNWNGGTENVNKSTAKN